MMRSEKTRSSASLARSIFLCAMVAFACAWLPATAHDAAPATGASSVRLDPGLGPLHHPVSTRNRQAQAYFDQGMKLVFAFNHEAAIQSFERAAQLDPSLAMAYWGIALALGPNINRPMDADAHKAAYAALQKAIALAPKASAADRAYIGALSKRYTTNTDADVMALQVAYKDAMKALVHRYPNDNDAAVLYAESLMDLNPWKFWTPNGTPADGTLEIVAVLERVLARQPTHIGANHYYIHAVEASPHPEKAQASAKRLETLAPSAGHLVHMPAHTFIRTGKYLEAARANVAAARADERLVKTGAESFYLIGYYGHNLHFLAISNAFAGNSSAAIAAANKLYDVEAPRIKTVPFVDPFLFTPALMLVQFGRWDEVLALPEPAFEAPITSAMWHFARALAFAGKGRTDDAQAERAKFLDAAGTLTKTMEYGNNNAAALAAVARPYLDGRMAMIAGDNAAAITFLRQAVVTEDALTYDEPPGWYLPSRNALGVALVRSGDFVAAEQVFREELVLHPESGRALFGLQTALLGQGRDKEAAALTGRLQHAWRGADVELGVAAM
jgi:tetratricopeptide (TPR) repeat protein